MKTFYDCIPCFLKQAVSVSRLSSPGNDKLHGDILKEVMAEVSKIDMETPPPVVSSRVHRIIKSMTGNNDPYKTVKDKFNKEAMDFYPVMKKMVKDADDPFETAVRLAVAGNIIDFGLRDIMDDLQLVNTVKEVIAQDPFIDHTEFLKKEINKAEKILYLADNTGEVVFDRVLIEQIMPEKITLAVRKYPIINDANYEDAEFVGLTSLVKVIDNGTDVPGTYLNECSDSFKKEFNSADLIISKGQGNYETLNDVNANIFFLLRAKCECVSKDIGCKLNDILIYGKKYA